MRNNENMSDPRDLVFIGASDGVPYFKNRNGAAGWIFILRTCLPDGLWNDPALCHMFAVAPSSFQFVDEEGKLRTVKR